MCVITMTFRTKYRIISLHFTILIDPLPHNTVRILPPWKLPSFVRLLAHCMLLAYVLQKML